MHDEDNQELRKKRDLEKWEWIKNSNKNYAVSNYGRVKSSGNG